MVVDAVIWYWTPTGMRRARFRDEGAGYIERREVERLLEEADERRRVAMSAAGDGEVKS